MVFLPALQNSFVVFDDEVNFLTNPYYRGLGRSHLTWMFTSVDMGHYIPLTWITLGFDYLLWGMNPFGYHLTNVVLHVGTAVAFYVVSLRLIGAATNRTGSWTTAAGATAAALVFGIHPLRVESVAWITERRDVLSGLFYMLTLLAWLRAVRDERVSLRWYWTAVALFGCAVLSKVIVVTLPVVLLILDLYPLRRLGGSHGWWSPQARRAYLETLPFFGLAAAGALVARWAITSGYTSIAEVGVLERVAVSVFGLAFYLWQSLWPVRLSPLYEMPLHVYVTEAPYLLSASVVILISIAAVSLLRRVPSLAAAWGGYVITVLPVIGVFQNGPHIAADRNTYLACLPWALVFGGAVAAATGRVASSPARYGVMAALLVALAALGVKTVAQIAVWRDSVSLWRHAVRMDPTSPMAEDALAGALLTAGRPDEASVVLRAAEWLPRSPRLKSNAAVIFGAISYGKGDLVGAVAHYRRAVALDSQQPYAWNNLGVVRAQQGDYAEALEAFQQSLRILPGMPGHCANARRVARLLGRAVGELDRCPPS